MSGDESTMRVLSKTTVAQRLDVSTKTIDRMVAAGEFPSPDMSIGDRSDRWFLLTVEMWMMRKALENEKAVKGKTAKT